MSPPQVRCLPVPKLNLWQKIARWLPRHCKYCGRRYVPVHQLPALFEPIGAQGRGCPLGHMGYVTGFNLGYGAYRDEFDYVKYNPNQKEHNDLDGPDNPETAGHL